MAEAGSFADRVKQQADIVRVVGEYVRLKKSGQNFTGLCPFHGEKSPSFAVHPVKQIFHCFGCGKGGDVFSFVMEMEKCQFPEAVRIVAENVASPFPTRKSILPKNARKISSAPRWWKCTAQHRPFSRDNSIYPRRTGRPRLSGRSWSESRKLFRDSASALRPAAVMRFCVTRTENMRETAGRFGPVSRDQQRAASSTGSAAALPSPSRTNPAKWWPSAAAPSATIFPNI